jgi:ABC-type transport system substrate-binding protein
LRVALAVVPTIEADNEHELCSERLCHDPASAILCGRVDYVRITDPVTARKAKATPGLTATDYYQSVIQATWVNNKKKPLDDPRVRRAMHLVLDKPVLVDVVKDVAPMMVGGFIYPFSEFASYQFDREVNAGKRLALIRQAEAIMEQDPPLLPISWEKINAVWYNYVKAITLRILRALRGR